MNIEDEFPIPSMDKVMKSSTTGLRKKIQENNLIVTKTDKGNATVVLDKKSFDDKVFEALKECRATLNEYFNFSAK